MWIHLISYISGGRPDGTQWPPAGYIFEVDDWEGDHLIRGGMAVKTERPQGIPERKKAEASEAPPVSAEGVVSQPSHTAAGPAGEEQQAAPETPNPSDPRQAWVDYAISKGVAAAEIAKMTKADLQSRYGGRL